MKITILRIEQVTNFDKGANLFNIHYLNKKGVERVWRIASRKKLKDIEEEIFNGKRVPDGVAIFAVHEESNKVVLLHEYRTSINSWVYTFPGGMMEEGEEIPNTAIREFKEETGLDLKVTEYTPPLYSAMGITDEKISLAYGTCTGEISTEFQTDNEDAQIIFLDKCEIERILKEELVASKTYFALREYLAKTK